MAEPGGGPSKKMLSVWMVRKRPWGSWLAFHLSGISREFPTWPEALEYANRNATRGIGIPR